MITWPFLGALALATGTLLERIILMKKKISVKLYQTAEFLAIVMVMIPFVPFFWKVAPEFTSPRSLLIFAGVIGFSLLANYFTFYSMKWEKLSRLEPAKITEPLFIILIAFIFSFIFGEEMFSRNIKVLIPAMIAGIALIASHVKKHHLKFSKYFIAALLGSFFFAIELILSRLILEGTNAVTFYFLRCAAILVISFIAFRPKFYNNLDTRSTLQLLAVGGIWFAYRVIIYFGYVNFGVVETTLTLMLGPVLIYLFAWKFLKEKLTTRNIISSIVILAAIAYAIFA